MVTVGYGDIHATQQREMLLSVLNMMVACGVFGYFLNVIGQIVQEYFFIEENIRKNMLIINRYMQNKNVDNELRY